MEGWTWGDESLEATGGHEAGPEGSDALVVISSAQALADGEAVLRCGLHALVGAVGPVGREGDVPVVAGPAPLAEEYAPWDRGCAAAGTCVLECLFEVHQDTVVLGAEADRREVPQGNVAHVVLQDLVGWQAVSVSCEKDVVAVQIKSAANRLPAFHRRSESQRRVWTTIEKQSRMG